MREQWREIPGYPGYKVSNMARVKSLNKWVTHNYGGSALKKGKILAQNCNSSGYLSSGLTIEKKTFTVTVHRLVALAFIPNPENKKEINHKDGNKRNNLPKNLEWVTQVENIAHAIANGLRGVRSGEYTDEQLKKLREVNSRPIVLWDTVTGKQPEFKSMREAGESIGVSQNVVSQAKYRGSKIHKRYLVIDAGLAIDKSTLKEK